MSLVRGRRAYSAAPRTTAAALTPPQTAAKLPRPTAVRATAPGATPSATSIGSTAIPTANTTTPTAAKTWPRRAIAESSATSAWPTTPPGNFAEIAVLHLAVLHSLAAVLQVTAPPC